MAHAGERGTRLRRARSVVLGLLTAELVVLVVTGVALYFVYRPGAGGLRTAHQVASWAMIQTALVAVVILAIGRLKGTRWGPGLLAVGVLALTAAASVTGYLLPWDQLALRAVTVGGNIDGYGVLLDDRVRFVLSGGVELSPGTVLRWLAVHALVLGPALVVLVGMAWRHDRRPA